jgi:hypothetical protein
MQTFFQRMTPCQFQERIFINGSMVASGFGGAQSGGRESKPYDFGLVVSFGHLNGQNGQVLRCPESDAGTTK